MSGPQHRSCPEQWGWDRGGWRGRGEALTSHFLIAGQTHSASLFFSKGLSLGGHGSGGGDPLMRLRAPHGGACAGCSLQGECRGLLLSVKVASPYSKLSGTFIFNPSHEQFSRHILVLKGHRQGEPAPLRLVGWSCCQASRAGAARSLERPHPSSPRGIAHQKLSGCWQGPRGLPTLTGAELHTGTPRLVGAGCSRTDSVFPRGLCQAPWRSESGAGARCPPGSCTVRPSRHTLMLVWATWLRPSTPCPAAPPDLTPPGPHPCFPPNVSAQHPSPQSVQETQR